MIRLNYEYFLLNSQDKCIRVKFKMNYLFRAKLSSFIWIWIYIDQIKRQV